MPAAVKVKLYVPPATTFPESHRNRGPSPVAVWFEVELLAHSTESPSFSLAMFGVNLKFVIETLTVEAKASVLTQSASAAASGTVRATSRFIESLPSGRRQVGRVAGAYQPRGPLGTALRPNLAIGLSSLRAWHTDSRSSPA